MAKPRKKNMAKKKNASPMPKLTEGERDLLDQMQDGYELETDSLGGNPVLRRLKDGEVIRPLSANVQHREIIARSRADSCDERSRSAHLLDAGHSLSHGVRRRSDRQVMRTPFLSPTAILQSGFAKASLSCNR
jgi:hypothetical protein